MKNKANVQLIKQLNERKILNLIRDFGPISRNELSKRSKISKVAVSEIVNRLDEAGFILEIGKGKSTKRGGKRPILLKLNPRAGFVIGIEIKQSYSRIAIADVESQINAIDRIDYKPGINFDDFISLIRKKISALTKKARVKKSELISIGIAVPGVVDYETGELHAYNKFSGWSNFSLVERFYKIYSVPIILENDANTIALGEKLLGSGKGISNLVCLWLGEGLGAGIIMRDQLIRGENGNTGEIGFFEAPSMLPRHREKSLLFRGQQFLGELISDANLLNSLKEIDSELYFEKKENIADDRLLLQYLQKAETGDQNFCEVIDEYAEIIADCCTTLIKTLNPSLIILNGFVIENSAYVLQKIIDVVNERMKNIPFNASKIVAGKLQKMAGIKGAIALALQNIFELPVTSSRNHIPLTAQESN